MAQSSPDTSALPAWQQIQFGLLMGMLSDWRSADHEDSIRLCRSDVIAMIDGVKALKGLAQGRVPKVRTSHHRNKEEAARLQALVDQKYTEPAQAQSSDRITQAIRDYCISLGSAVQLSSDGVERIYYSGISIVGLADAILANAAPANRSTAKATANVGDNGERMGSEPAMGIVTGGSDPTPSMMSSTDKREVDDSKYFCPGGYYIGSHVCKDCKCPKPVTSKQGNTP